MDPRTPDLAKRWMRSRMLALPDGVGADRDAEVAMGRQVLQAFHQFPDVLQELLEFTLFKPATDWRLPPDQRDAYALITQGRHQVAIYLLYLMDLAEHAGETDATSQTDFFGSVQPGRGRRGDAASGDAAGGLDLDGPAVGLN